MAGTISGGAFVFTFGLATVVDEWLDRLLRFWPLEGARASLFDGEVDEKTNRPTSLFSRALVLPNERLISDAQAELLRKIGAGELKVVEGQPDPVPRTVVLRGWSFRRAVFTDSDLRRADLTGADLRGARLVRVWLQGAYFERAQLQGATLWAAQLQGADLNGAQLRAADLRRAALWRARGAPDLDAADLRGASLNEHTPPPDPATGGQPADWHALVERWLATIPPRPGRDRAEEPLRVLTLPVGEEPLRAVAFRALFDMQAAPDPGRVAEALRRLACDPEHAPYVARGILLQIAIDPERGGRDLGDHRGPLARALLDEAACPGARGLTDDERRTLRAITEGRR